MQNAYQMILRMCMRAPASLICAMVMAFTINVKLASIYLAAVILLGTCLFFIMNNATKYFQQAFPKYDDMKDVYKRQRIGYIRGAYRIKGFRSRWVGCQTAARKHRLEIRDEDIITLSPTSNGAYKDMLAYLENAEDLATAFFADNDIDVYKRQMHRR